jgi:uncharacterized protein YaaQ
MKFVIAIIQDYDTNAFLTALSSNGIMSTRIASAGGFLRQGNTTVFSVVEDDQVPLFKRLLKQHCGDRTQHWPELDLGDEDLEHVAATRVGGGVAFVVRVAHFEKVPIPGS